MSVFRCECDSAFGSEMQLCDHIRRKHGIEVHKGCLGSPHWGYCNQDTCTRVNGHGRRIPDFEALKRHLSECQYLNVFAD